ncbi:MAG: hypothetical protein PVF68_01990 [Acidobacteriota bacterium]
MAGIVSVVSLGAVLTPPPEPVRSCAPCHHRAGNDPVGEWLASPYSQIEGGRGCADCHGEKCSGNGEGARPFPRARVPGAAAHLTLSAACSKGRVEAEAVVTNLGAGHDLPTGPVDRSLVLQVTAHDREGVPLSTENSAPAAGPAARRVFAGGTGCEGARSRGRLAPFETDVSRYSFLHRGAGPVRVRARLFLTPRAGPCREIAGATSVCNPSGNAASAGGRR